MSWPAAVSRKRPLCREQSAPTGDFQAWRSHPRLQRHIAKLCGNKDPFKVLARYRSVVRTLPRVQLHRHIVHVAAWVALLPCDSEWLLDSVQLLTFLLQGREGMPLSQWLHGVLQLVHRRIRELCKGSSNDDMEPWLELKNVMPEEIWKSPNCATIIVASCLGLESSGAQKANSADRHSADLAEEEVAAELGHSSALLNKRSDHRQYEEWERKLRKLHTEGKQFESLSLVKRCARVDSMEAQAQIAVSDWDPVAAFKLAHKIVAMLSPPRASAHGVTQSESSFGEDAIRILELQTRLRAMLLNLLGILDLSDVETKESILCVASHISTLIGRFEASGRNLRDAQKFQQWRKLRSMFHQCSEGSSACVPVWCQAKLEESYSDMPQQHTCAKEAKPVKTGRCKHVDRARISDTYEPGARVKALPNVENRPRESKVLKCQECSHRISSSWFFVHPQTQEAKVLVPIAGHAACGRKLKKRAYFVVVDESPYKMDNFGNVDYCQHGRMRKDCAPCGGKGLCEHGKQRRCCKVCRVLIRHRKPKDQCPIR